MLSQGGHPSFIYFVDDNFIGNRKATREMLPHLIAWQKKRGHPLRFGCEATLNIAKQPEILSLMRQAEFQTVFVGIETPEVDALKQMRKEQNATLPILEGISTLNSYGLEVTSGIILGLDTDTADTEERLKAFIDASNVPILTINLLQALPKTPLWDRLKRDQRLIADDSGLESNVRFLRPYDEVVAMWRRCIAHAYAPERLFDRFAHQVEATYANRLADGPVRGKLTWNNIGLASGARLQHRPPHRVARRLSPRLLEGGAAGAAPRPDRRRAVDGVVGHHMITFAREAVRGEQNASFYSTQDRRMSAQAPPARREFAELRKSG